MDKNSFIMTYVASFLAERAERFYDGCSTVRDADYGWMSRQPVNDAIELAEQAWASIRKSVPQYLSETVGSVATVTTEMASTPIMSITPENAEAILSAISSPSAGNATEPTTTGI